MVSRQELIMYGGMGVLGLGALLLLSKKSASQIAAYPRAWLGGGGGSASGGAGSGGTNPDPSATGDKFHVCYDCSTHLPYFTTSPCPTCPPAAPPPVGEIGPPERGPGVFGGGDGDPAEFGPPIPVIGGGGKVEPWKIGPLVPPDEYGKGGETSGYDSAGTINAGFDRKAYRQAATDYLQGEARRGTV